MIKPLKLIAVSIAAVAAVALLSLFQFTNDLEQETIDLREIAFAPETGGSPRIVMVWLDEDTMRKLPYRSPVPRDFLAKLNDRLAKAKPAAIGYDVYLKDPSFPGPDRELAKSLAAAPAYAVEPMRDSPDGAVEGVVDPPLTLFADALKGTGLADLPIAAFDTKVRYARLAYHTNEGETPTIAAKLFTAVTGTDAREAVGAPWHRPRIALFGFTPFFSKGDRILIRYAGPPSRIGARDNAFKVFSARLVADGVIPLEWFADKIVLVGAAYSDLMDAYPTPYYGRSTDFARMNGVEIHANILNQLMTGQFYYGPLTWQRWLFIALIALICAACALYLSPIRAAFAVVFVIVLTVAAAVYAVYQAAVMLPVVAPIAAALAAFGVGIVLRAFAEGRQKRMIKQVFARYVPGAVVDRIAKDPSLATLGGEDRRITSLFTDLASFTSISERIAPAEVIDFLNDYLELVNAIVLDHDGTIDKYQGDAVVAFFNAPLDVDAHEAAALKSAIAIQEATREVSARWEERLGQELITRVGVHTGHAVVGNLGSEGRFDYTAIGDTINLASRLEGANKFYGTRVLASEDTVAFAGDELVARPVDRVRVKGRERPVLVHEVLNTAHEMDDALMKELVEPYRKAFALYEHGESKKALALFGGLAKAFPGDGPARMMVDRCEYVLANPDWDRVTDLKSK